MRYLEVFATPDRLTGPRCREVRRRWDLHVLHVADCAKVDRTAFQLWERGAWRKATPAWRASVCTALRTMVLEQALETAVVLALPGDDRVANLRLLPPSERKRSAAGSFQATRRVVVSK